METIAKTCLDTLAPLYVNDESGYVDNWSDVAYACGLRSVHYTARGDTFSDPQKQCSQQEYDQILFCEDTDAWPSGTPMVVSCKPTGAQWGRWSKDPDGQWRCGQ